MKRSVAKKKLALKFKLDEKTAGLIIDFLESHIGMKPPTFKARGWSTFLHDEWESEPDETQIREV